jgi:hypothetical protein
MGRDFSVIILLSIKQNLCNRSFDAHYFLLYLLCGKQIEGSWAELLIKDAQPDLLIFND